MKSKNCRNAFIWGLICILFSALIFPIVLAIVYGIYGLKEQNINNKWQGTTGLMLGIFYAVLFLANI